MNFIIAIWEGFLPEYFSQSLPGAGRLLARLRSAQSNIFGSEVLSPRSLYVKGPKSDQHPSPKSQNSIHNLSTCQVFKGSKALMGLLGCNDEIQEAGLSF